MAEESPILMRYLDTDTGALTNYLSGVNSTVRRQDMPLIYKVNGVIYVNSAADYLSGRSLNDNPYALITPKAEAVDIDEKDDLLFAEYMVKKGMVSLP